MINRPAAAFPLHASVALALLAGCLVLGLAGCTPPESAAPDERGVDPEAVRRNTLGSAMMSRNDPAEAVRHFRAALEVDPALQPARVNLGIALLSQGETEEAAGVLEEAVAADPSQARGWFTLGLARHRQGDREGALESFEKARRLEPQDAATLFRLGQLRASLGDGEGARDAYDAALALRPQFLLAMHALGMLRIRLGEPDAGRALVERAQELREAGLGEPMGEAYGEQGPLAMVADAAGPELPPELVAPTFTGATPAGPWDGSGVRALAAADLEHDGRLELLVGHDTGYAILRQSGGRSFAAASSETGSPVVGFLAADLMNTGRAVVLVLTAEAGRPLSVAPAALDGEVPSLAGLSGSLGGPWPDGALAPAGGAADIDHDGDLDVVLALPLETGDGTRLHAFRNLGEGRFEEMAAAAGLAEPFANEGGPALPVTSVTFLDYDQDRDLDILAVAGRATRLYSNQRDGTFADAAGDAKLVVGGPATSVAAADLDADGWTDLVISGVDPTTGPGLTILRSASGREYERVDAPETSAGARVVAADLDVDGWTDLLAVGEGGDAALAAFRNMGDGSWSPAGASIAEGIPGGPAGPVVAADLDGDGFVDVAHARETGLFVRWNDGIEGRRGLTVDLEGVVSSRQGVGARVEVRAGRLFNQQWPMVGGNLAAPTTGILTFGLGDRPSADAVRILWPNGVLQDEIDIVADGHAVLKQVDRKGTSCPILYAWNGEDYAFVTDFLGGCAMGYYLGGGAWSVPDTDEWVRVDGDRLRPAGTEVRLMAANQLEEVIVFDAFRLVAVDHPEGAEAFPRERLLPGPPYEPFRNVVVTDARPPVSARDGRGHDVLPLIAENDRRWPDDFRRLAPKGYAEEHTLVLDLGDTGDAVEVLLLLDGWIDYADSASNLQASQAGLTLLPPRLDVRLPSGEWKTVTDRMGFPAGLPKPMVVPIDTAVFEDDARVVRIVTSMRIAWDRVRVATDGGAEALITELPLRSAELSFVGYPRTVMADGRDPRSYDWSDRSRVAPWKSHAGRYTRFGPVSPLVRAVDDRYVITRHGDGVELVFDAAAAPALPPGWVRDYYLFADGFGKDMDPISAVPWTVEPYPWHGMSAYPPSPGESHPDPDLLEADLAEYHTRVVHDIEPARLTVERRD